MGILAEQLGKKPECVIFMQGWTNWKLVKLAQEIKNLQENLLIWKGISKNCHNKMPFFVGLFLQ